METLFDEFGGYYSVLVDDVEVARFAPGPVWSEYADEYHPSNWSYVWVWGTKACEREFGPHSDHPPVEVDVDLTGWL